MRGRSGVIRWATARWTHELGWPKFRRIQVEPGRRVPLNRVAVVIGLSLTLGASGGALAQCEPGEARLVLDINTTTASSRPWGFTEVGGRAVFAATTRATGEELHVSDGSAAGTRLLADLRSGPESSEPEEFIRAGPFVYFTADDGTHGRELWRTDGTLGGTIMLADLWPGAFDARPTSLIDVGGQLFFVAVDGSSSSHALFVTDGMNVRSLGVTPRWRDGAPILGAHAGHAWFAGHEPSTGVELWASNGTPAGTFLVADLAPGPASSFPSGMASANGMLWFSASADAAGDEPWIFDDGTGDSRRIADLAPGDRGSSPSDFIGMGGITYFTATGRDGQRELHRSDGTEAGTWKVADPTGPMGSSSPGPYWSLGDRLVFLTRSSQATQPLWTTDGTPHGTHPLLTLSSTSVDWYDIHATAKQAGSELVFVAIDEEHGCEPWITDGHWDGTRVLADIQPGPASSSPRGFGVALGRLFLGADATGRGNEPHACDLRAGGAAFVADVEQATESSSPRDFVAHGGVTYFSANDGVTGRELWRTDGTAAGTARLEDRVPGLAGWGWRSPCVSGGRLFAWMHDPVTGVDQLHVATGSPVDAVPLMTSGGSSFAGSFVGPLVPFRGGVAFRMRSPAHGYEPWFSDGTVEGTRMIADVRPGASDSSPVNLTVSGDALFFHADDGTHGRELWISDGTEAGTRMAADIGPGHAVDTTLGMVAYAGGVAFVADDGLAGQEVWVSDGTSNGTRLVADLILGQAAFGELVLPAAWRGGFFLRGGDDAEPYSWDGWSRPVLVRDIHPGLVGGSSPRRFTSFAGGALFEAAERVAGPSLWFTDGTESGTVSLGDVDLEGATTSSILTGSATAWHRVRASPSTAVESIWATNGTPGGTHLVTSSAEQDWSSLTHAWGVVNDRLYLAGVTPEHGAELHVHVPDADGDGIADGCDPCPRDAFPAGTADADGDGWGDACDACPGTPDPAQSDVDADGLGDACDEDADGDGLPARDPSGAMLDCDDLNAGSQLLGEIQGLRVGHLGTTVLLRWQPLPGAGANARHDVVSGPLGRTVMSRSAPFDRAACVVANTEDTGHDLVRCGDAWFLVRVGMPEPCGEGTFGRSLGAVNHRVILDSLDCP